MGRLIVIEGTDSSGKETQTKKLYERLTGEGYKVKRISFPNYESPASQPVKMYLAGEFGKEAGSVNPYPISTMYAIDRYASFKKDWGKDYEEDVIILADRYTTSNMVHQASKIDNEIEKKKYLEWLLDLEYNKMKLPIPNSVIFLKMPTEKAAILMENRKNKITGESEKDIHEIDVDYMKKSYDNACWVANNYNWNEVLCVSGDEIKSINQIHDEIYTQIIDLIK